MRQACRIPPGRIYQELFFMKHFIYFIVIAAAILAIMGLFQRTAHAATEAGDTSPPQSVLFSNVNILDGKYDTSNYVVRR